MNAKNYLLNLLFVGSSIALLSSCEKNDVYNPDNDKKMSDLVVPDGFDWAMTRDVTFSMQSPAATSVVFYLDKSCKQAIAELPVKEGKNSVTLNLPTESSSVWIKYPTKLNGKEGEEVKEVSVRKGSDTRTEGQWEASVLFPDYVYANNKYSPQGYKYQPAKDLFGTLMFEDQWPDLGDYDFNDFVVNYNMESELAQDYKSITLTMRFKIRAIGGSLPYRFCVQIGRKEGSLASMNILKEDVELLGYDVTNNGDVGGTVELLDTQYTIVAFSGFEKLKGRTGGAFYNTLANNLMQGADKTPVVTVRLKITPDKTTATTGADAWRLFSQGFGGEDAFDFFLQRDDNKREIHFLGFPATEMYTSYQSDLGNGNSGTTYFSKDRFVWALKAPSEIGWATERTYIAMVYPEFVTWVQTGGNWLEGGSWTDSNRQWYGRPHVSAGGGNYVDPASH